MKELIVQSDITNISIVEKLVDDISTEHSLNSDVYGKLLLAVVEGVNNAIVHGNKLNADLDVNINYDIDEKHISFTIKDQGNGFDYQVIPDPTLPENIEKSHGRGIFLMNHLADKIEFENNGSTVKLIFDL